jgi:serine/threonine-protein kinase
MEADRVTGADDDARLPVEGDVLAGKYVVERVLGAGGMGVVVAAKHVELGERVALKFLLPAAASRGDMAARFQREARAAVRIKSEHVARISDVGRLPNGAPYMVMEYLAGRDLAAELAARGALPIALAVEWVLQACEAIAEAHALGIVHRDLKPANLFLTKRADGSDLVKVLDFGIPKAAADEAGAPSLTATHGIMGSPLYMSPEQIRSSKNVDARADVWSLGVILQELVTGKPPFHADAMTALLAAILTDAPAPLRLVLPSAPVELERAVSRCLEKDVALRMPSVAAFADALSPFASPSARFSIERITKVLGAGAYGATMLPDAAPPAPSVASAMPDTAAKSTGDTVLAVLPFDNLSTDPEMQFFSDGVSEEIIQRLSRGAHLKVIGRTSSFQFRGDRKADAASALKCSHVLDGSVRRAASRVRVSAHLVEATSQTTLWSERYDRAIEDMFGVQDEISEQIAAALQHTFTSRSSKGIDPTVFDLYLKASLRTYSPDEARAHVGMLEAATARAPHFAEAWGRLSATRAFLRLYQPWVERAESGARVRQEAERALALDPQNADALSALYLALPPFGSFDEADAAVERLRRAPGLGADSAMFVGWHHRAVGRVHESAEETERGYRLDALHPLLANAVAMARMSIGQIDRAVPILEDLLVRVPGMSFPVANLLRARAFRGDWAAFDALLDPKANHPLREFEDGLAFLKAKRDPTPDNIGAMRDALSNQVARTGCVDLSRLVYVAHLGLVDDAYRAADEAHIGPRGTSDDVIGVDAYRTGILFWHDMAELRNDPRFARLCARLGLVEHWLTSGKWPDCTSEVPYDFRAECEKARATPKEDLAF